ncbi:MAG: hypothetical protein K8S97_04805, partial [Anaerolineae bacterium]|nr:hypothetical protein [Anaerolineae bacterium]
MKKLLSLLLIVTVLVVPALTALAQDGNPACQGLSAEDCETLLAAQAALALASSFAMPAWEIGLTLNIPPLEEGMEALAVEFSASGSGALSLDPAADVVLDLVIDEVIISDGTETFSGSAHLILTPTMGYVQWEDKWYGGPMEDGDLPSAYDLTIVGQLSDVSTALAMMGIDLTGVVMTTRDGDVFTTDIDIAGLIVAALQSPMLGSLAGDLMGGDDMGGMELDEETMGMLAMFLPALLGTSTLSTSAGVADGNLNMIGVDLVIDM